MRIEWDGKLVLAALFTVGYFFIIYMLVGPQRSDLSGTQKEIATIALAALGPQLGQIYAAIFRTTGADERQAALRSADLQKAIETPSTVAAPPVDDQVREGAREGTRAGVNDALNGSGQTNEPAVLS